MVKKTITVNDRNKNFTVKSITIRPDNENKLLTYNQIVAYHNKFIPKGVKTIVRAENILRNTTLKGPNDDFDKEQFDMYTKGKVVHEEKFKAFYSFTIDIYTPK